MAQVWGVRQVCYRSTHLRHASIFIADHHEHQRRADLCRGTRVDCQVCRGARAAEPPGV